MDRYRMDGLTLAALAFLFFLGFNLICDPGAARAPDTSRSERLVKANAPTGGELQATFGDMALASPGQSIAYAAQATPIGDPGVDIIRYPYDQFIVTQGPHGAEYNQMAIDISAGKGVTIRSPITGQVSALYVDEYGNPVLVLDNPRYTVMLYHGDFTVEVGASVAVGQPVGTEGNRGYTVDGFGQLCANRDCGYHTHLNVFDKRQGVNVNPLQVLQLAAP